MGANEIQQSMLEAMQLLSKKAADSTNAAITIKGEIIEELDSGTHQYSISYGGAIYKDAYSLGNVSYPSSTIVYILIPDGNFDNTKIILKAVSADATNYVTESETDIYVPISSNLFGDENSIDLKSWVNSTQTLDLDTNNFGIIFKDYLNTYRNFVFSANIKTEIDVDHQAKGNYGLILNLPFIQSTAGGDSSEVWRSYVMDVSTMQGNPYAFNEYQKEDLYYNIDNTLEYDINRIPFITAFVQDFGYATPRTDINYDIHIKDISVKMVDILSEADTTGYYLAVVPSEGNYFLNGKYVNKKTLTPLLKVNAKTTDYSSWDCYWFVEDSSINVTSEGYLPLGGLGWKCLNKKINITYDAEGNKTFQYITNSHTLTVEDTDVISTLRYKCVLTKDTVVVGGSVRLKNLNSSIQISLATATGENTFIENVGNVRLIAKIYYPGVTDVTTSDISLSTVWQRFDKDGNYIDNDFYTIIRYNDKVDNYFETEILYPCSILEKLNTINCTFYSKTIVNSTVVQNNLGTASIIVNTAKNLSYGLSIEGGDVLYKYDADGDSPLVANYDGPASSKIKTIKPITFKVFKPNGLELNETEYLYVKYKWSFPKNSMMKLSGYSTAQLDALEQDDDYYYIIGYGNSSINYIILPTFNKKKNNNTILLQVDFDGNQISESTNPKFLKDGESGTNGSKYATVLTYQDYAYGERDELGRIRKLQAIYIAGDSWKIYDIDSNSLIDFNEPELEPIVYKDGERITSGYAVAWDMFDITQTNPAFNVVNGILSIRDNWDSATDIYSSIVQCAITITEDSSTNSREVIYAYYPIEVTRLINSSMADNIIPNLDGGFEQVTYTSDGTNPQYDNTNNFECVDNVYNDDAGDYYDYLWSVSDNLKISAGAGTGPSVSIKPVTKFDNGLTKNYVKVSLSMSAAKRQELIDEITNLDSEIITVENKIDFYQHNKSRILDFSQKFEYNIYEEKIKNAKRLFNYRYELLNYIPKLREVLEELNTYCIENNIRISDFNYTRYYTLYNSTLDSVHKNLYLLGYTRELGDISDLANTTIIVDITRLTNNYSAVIAQQVSSYANMWTSLVNKYQEVYVKLVQQSSNQYVLQDEYDELVSFNNDLNDFVHDYDLTYLTTAHDNNDPEQDFVLLKDQLLVLYSQIGDYETGKLISYSSFVNDLLKPINEALEIYKNTEYQERYYENINTQLNETLTELQNKKASDEAYLLPAQSDYIIHIKPIIMLFNRYEMGNINGWDGSKLYVDETNNEYLLAPQVGAGAKKDGLFTGVIMGVKQFNASNTQHIGLFGYGDGVQSFFMNADDGSTIFGKSGSGQIIADPSNSKALLYSSNYWKTYNNDGKPSSYSNTNVNDEGMLIDLSTPEIKFGNGNFKVNSDGHITAKGGGEIAGWKISNTELYSNVAKIDGRVTLDSSGIGKIYSHSHDTLESTNQGFYLSSDGLSIGNSIRVAAEDGGSILVGRLTGSRHWTISGDIDNSYIAYGTTTINTGNNSVYVGTNGISLGTDKFYVDNAGNLTSKAGTIGNWTINSTTLTAGNTTLNSNGTITCSNLEASSSGHIGGWTIGSSSLTAGNTTLSADGTITCTALYASNTGSIGGWSIGGSSLSGGGITLGSGGTITGAGFALSGSGLVLTNPGGASLNWGNGFNVGSDGILRAQGAIISGNITASSGKIGGWNIDSSGLASGSTHIYPNGISIGGLIVPSTGLSFSDVDRTMKNVIDSIPTGTRQATTTFSCYIPTKVTIDGTDYELGGLQYKTYRPTINL